MEHVQQGRVRGMRIVFVIFSLVHAGAGKLEIRKTDSPIDALLGENTTIPCLFSGYEASSLDTSIISVRWKRKDELVYDFISGHHTPYRSGSYISEDGLREEDASLYIPDIQISDEGDYTCFVIVRPENAISKVTVQLSAFPSCILSDSTLLMNPNMEKSVTCYVNGFYPESVKIQWLKYSKASSNQSPLNSQHCASVPVQNHDGTYNVTSVLYVRPMSTDEDGDVYSCVISHRSWTDGLNCNVSLSVHPVPESYLVEILSIVSVLLLAVLAGVLIYIRYIKKAPVEIMDFIGPELNHMQKTTLVCTIVNLTSKDIDLRLSIKKDDKEPQVDEWSSKTAKRDEEIPLDPHRHPNLKLRPMIEPSGKGFFRCVCSIDITPQFDEHHGAKMTLEVKYEAVKDPIYKVLTLEVKVAPVELMDFIVPELNHMQKTNWLCTIVNLTSTDIDLRLSIKKDDKKPQVAEWSSKTGKNDEEIPLDPYLKLRPFIATPGKGLFSCVCSIDITPQFDEHHCAKMILEVKHEAVKDPIRKELTLAVKVPFQVMDITEPKLIHMQKTTLECVIENFIPKDIDLVLYIIKDNKKSQVIEWSSKTPKTNQEIHPHLTFRPSVIKSLKVFFRCVCYIDITPQFDEHHDAKMILEVNHKLAKGPIYKGLTLEVKAPPVLDPIKANKESYNVGDPLVLTCKIHSFHPQNINVTWCKDKEALDSENIESGKDTIGLFYVTSRVQATIQEGDFRKEFWCQVEHQGETKDVTWKLQKQVQASE